MTKKISLLIFPLLGILFLTNPSPSFAISWTKYLNNPVLDLGPDGSWEDAHVSTPAVLFDGTIYKMWYGGHDGTNWRIGYATSPDGKNWTKYEGNPVLELKPELDGEKHVTEPTVIFDGENYKMWYTSELQIGSRWRIGYATSSDGIHWNRHPDFVLTASEVWEADGVATPFVLKDGALYKMWYAARASGIWKIGYASSENGVVWSKDTGNPVLYPTQPSWEYTIVGHPSVIVDNLNYYLWYSAGPIDPHNIGYAISPDGVDWSNKPYPPENPALQRGPAGSFDHSLIVAPSVIKRGDVYQMWYGGSDGSHWRIGYAATGEIPPPPEEKTPIVLLPGFGASWNHQKIFLGQDAPQSAWKMTPFVKVYDNLLTTLEAAGYVKNQDLFVFNYDWTKPVDSLANDLRDYIDSVVDPPTNESSGKKAKLLAHSLGGLVGRAYIQNNPGTHQIEQLITLGSPHKGIPQVYKAWEGADLHGLLSEPLRSAAELLLFLRSRGYPNQVSAIQALVPSLKDLLFIEDYLKKAKIKKIIPESTYSQQNLWLKNLSVTPDLLSLLHTVVGQAGDTPRYLHVVKRSRLDKLLNHWEDGKPVKIESELGDQTVLESSAELTGTPSTKLPLNHGDLVRTVQGIESILSILGIDQEPLINPYPPDSPLLLFVLASPGNLKVKNSLGQEVGFQAQEPFIPNSLFLPDEKMIVVFGAASDKYKVQVIANEENGAYRLLVGQLTEKQDVWTEHQDTIATGEVKDYEIPIDNTLDQTPQFLSELIDSKLQAFLKKAGKEKLPFFKKKTIEGITLKMIAEFKTVTPFLKLKQNKKAKKLSEITILDNVKLINYLQKNNFASLLDSAKEIRDHLTQLHQIL